MVYKGIDFMKELLEIVVSGIGELLFWEKTEEYIQSDNKSSRKLLIPRLYFGCAVVIILGLIIVGIYEMIKLDIILGISFLVSAGGSTFYLWYRINEAKNQENEK